MKTLIVFGICAAAMFAGLAQAGVHVRVGYHDGPRYVHHRNHHDHYRPRHRYRHRYGYRRHHRSHGRDVAAGLIVGALIGSAFQSRSEPVVERRRVVHVDRDRAREPALRHHDESYLQQDSDGSCYWIDVLEDGTRTRERVADEECL